MRPAARTSSLEGSEPCRAANAALPSGGRSLADHLVPWPERARQALCRVAQVGKEARSEHGMRRAVTQRETVRIGDDEPCRAKPSLGDGDRQHLRGEIEGHNDAAGANGGAQGGRGAGGPAAHIERRPARRGGQVGHCSLEGRPVVGEPDVPARCPRPEERSRGVEGQAVDVGHLARPGRGAESPGGRWVTVPCPSDGPCPSDEPWPDQPQPLHDCRSPRRR